MDVGQYLEIFIDESSEHLQTLSDCIMTLEQEPDNKDTINEVFRAAHSLKGMAGTMGFKRMQHLTHDMENVFQEVRSDKIQVDSAMIDLLFECLDALDGYLANVKNTSDEGTEDNENIIKELNDFLAKANGETPKAAPKKEEAAKNEAPSEANTAEAASSGGGDANIPNLELTDKEIEDIKNAKDSGQKVYFVDVTIQKECLLKAARAFLVFKAVEEFGQILVFRPSSQEIEDENFELDFSFVFATSEDIAKIESAATSVSEIETIKSVILPDSALLDQPEEKKEEVKEEKKDSPAAPAAPAAPATPATPAAPAAKAGAANNKNTKVAKPVASRTVRVDIEKLDALMNQVSELIIAKNSIVSMSNTDGNGVNSQGFHEQIEYLERITTSLHESVMKVRMVPIESVVNKYPRMIRDLSRKLDKPMELTMTGEETELDRTVVDQIGDPLQHLLRNSADHGIESKELRAERGKPEAGHIFLNAYQEGNNVIIKVGDDGNGIDTEAVKGKAIERGIITVEQAESMSQKEIVNLLFMPSFSMAKKITDISGRGVGLDVVKSNIEGLGGDVEVESKFGEGSTFTVRLPLTLAIIQALLVEVHGDKYAIALGSILNIEDIAIGDIKYVENREVINLRGTVIPIIRMDRILGIEPREEDPEVLTVVIVNRGDNNAGLVVDSLVGQQEIVIKSLGDYIKANKLISGATILGDGEVALILDVNTLM
ncbi:chemotaxis protein CheA [Lachnobacterium bovis]|uniref:Chemotaxis protein CheA n=1 Tax=Lachnobacterium bovis TaxID=140626 RepID=A0A1H9Q4F7_9FIRM|nr:chemotaxis protein CheA [Lachnobacterium bovis]SER55320.1 two-component system, chemotaxis family, sensor kinase CheA [Lachnobacterium bovis]